MEGNNFSKVLDKKLISSLQWFLEHLKHSLFINGDGIIGQTGELLGHNMFAHVIMI